MTEIQLIPLKSSDTEQFITDSRKAFNHGALEQFGRRNDHFEEDGKNISCDTIFRAVGKGTAFRIMQNNTPVGGAVIRTEYDQGELELLFVSPDFHGKGIGYAAWYMIETIHPEITVWETVTPYFEKRNIHFLVNLCGFRIVEYFNGHHCAADEKDDKLFDIFRFEKILPSTPESIQAQIRRIMYYEDIMQKTENGSAELLKPLSEYYGSDAWKRDFAADETGLLPKDLKRGILSEDGIYNLLNE